MKFELDKFTVRKIYAVNNLEGAITKTITRTDRTLYSLAYKITGNTVYTCDGQEYVSDPNHIVLLNKNHPYSFVCSAAGACIMIEFDSDTVIDGFYSYIIRETTEMETLFRRIARLWTLKNCGYESACMACLYEIFSKIHIAQNLSGNVLKQRKLIAPAILYLEEHYADGNITNELLASTVGISTIYFRKIFTAIYQVSPIKYMQNLRIEKAKDLLLSDYNSVSYVAGQVGFSDIYAFSRAFKKSTGFSPSDYKKRLD